MRTNHLINLKPSPTDFWQNFLTIEHRKQVNRLKNTGVMLILTKLTQMLKLNINGNKMFNNANKSMFN